MLELLNKHNEKKVREILKEEFELKIKGQFFKIGKEKIWWFSGKISKDFLKGLLKLSKPECLGIYFGVLDKNKIRLSMDAAILFGKKAKKGILELNDEKTKKYLRGEEVEIKNINGDYYTQKNSKNFLGPKIQGNFVVLKNKDDFIGCGKVKGKRLWNYVPKERRIK